MSNVLFFPYLTYSPHFETELELMQLELDKGNKVYIVLCKNCFTNCAEKEYQVHDSCSKCDSFKRKVLKLLKSKIHFINLSQYLQKKDVLTLPIINSIPELYKLNFYNFPIGYGISKQLCMVLDEEDGFNKAKSRFSEFYSFGTRLYTALIDIANSNNIDYGYIFNGSLFQAKIMFYAFRAINKDIYVHERGCDFSKYIVFKNATPHDIHMFSQLVSEKWNAEKDINKKTEIATRYFEDKAKGKEKAWISFTDKQKKGTLPDNFNIQQKKIVIFNSSAHEFDYVSSEYTYNEYKDQTDGIKRICESLLPYNDIKIFVREHPHLKDVNNKQKSDLRKMHYPNLTIITCNNPIDSYAMLFNSDIVVTFNSTMGIEATFWGKPSICCSSSIYQDLDITYMPKTHAEVIQLLLSDLKPKDKIDTLKYGYYYSTFGQDYKYYKPTDLWNGTFKGIEFHKLNKTLYEIFLDKAIWLKKIFVNLLPYGLIKFIKKNKEAKHV